MLRHPASILASSLGLFCLGVPSFHPLCAYLFPLYCSFDLDELEEVVVVYKQETLHVAGIPNHACGHATFQWCSAKLTDIEHIKRHHEERNPWRPIPGAHHPNYFVSVVDVGHQLLLVVSPIRRDGMVSPKQLVQTSTIRPITTVKKNLVHLLQVNNEVLTFHGTVLCQPDNHTRTMGDVHNVDNGPRREFKATVIVEVGSLLVSVSEEILRAENEVADERSRLHGGHDEISNADDADLGKENGTHKVCGVDA